MMKKTPAPSDVRRPGRGLVVAVWFSAMGFQTRRRIGVRVPKGRKIG